MLATIAVVVLGALALLLFTPVSVSLRCEGLPVFRYRVGLRWLFGIVATEVGRASPQPRAAASDEPERKREPKSARKRRHHVGAMLATKGFLPGAARLLRRLVVALRLRIPYLWLRAGLDDPADTGILSAWLYPLSTYLSARSAGRFDVAPDFTGETLQFALRGEAHVVPARLLWPVVAFGLSPSTLRGLYALQWGGRG